jgi:2-oxoglutarate dehydrogenase E2 component (dihydrolipoamide succinyltransferase)
MLSIKVPPLGESIVEATVLRWLKKDGEAVASGDTLVELETDKITVEVPAPRAGVFVKRMASEGDVVKVGDMLGELDETATGAVAAAGSASADSSVKSSPAARRAATAAGIDVATVTGTGRGGIVSKPDVLERVAAGVAQPVAAKAQTPAPVSSAAAAPAPTPAPAAPASTPVPSAPTVPFMTGVPAAAGERETREKMSTRRKRIAENLLQSQHATAHLTTFNEVDMTAVNALRDRMRERVEKEHGVKLTFMPMFVKAACMALESYPVVNAQIDGDTVIYKHYVNMGIAVASDAGLVVPNIKDAHRKGAIEISRDISALAKRARDGKLTMDDLTGGTFTITNGGVFGSLVSTPIINYPQVGILGLHKTQDRPVAIDGKVEIRPMMYIALSYDHRIVDGQHAVLFLVRVKELIEDPAAMLIS